ncbi:MAG TPA: selenide, water dikinase SelD [Chloroflexota bacterium]|nr:selenide, water dikinase SelD [Chloroflexota bacterium]
MDLEKITKPLARYTHPDLLVGLQVGDDAAVFRVGDRAIIETVDFFAPVVDDPYDYGAIAAANSMSDVYAMGGEVLFALNIAAFPENLPEEIVTAIVRGGAEKIAEGGGVVVGGHTVIDKEPKFGFCVTGIADPAGVTTKGGRVARGPAGADEAAGNRVDYHRS